MVWRETFPPANELTLDVEAERERRLAAQARAGADWALTALIARYQPTVTRYLTRLCGDQGRARELSERVFQRMERRLHGPQGADNLRLWLLRASTEAGLETLRRPRRVQAPRLDATRVAGLLPAEAGDEARRVLQGGIKRLKNVVGAVSRQARPLVWQAMDTPSRTPTSDQNERPRAADELGPVDESLDTLDPREALRHRLVRLTLADLPYGDAQCLALHLVAGLNQAEVARALGLTNSAARKRIVQGLSQFSVRYQAAVRSLGLPEELGYGDALARRVEEERPVFAPPDPAPVIVTQTPEESAPSIAQQAPATVPLAIDTLDDYGEMASGVAYFAASSPGIQPEFSMPPEPDYFAPTDVGEYASPFEAEFDPFGAPDGSFAEPYLETPYESRMANEPDAALDEEAQEEADLSRSDAPYLNAGIVTRIAADAIVGPVVDALPVHSEPLATVSDFGAPSPRSAPLGYELDSSDADSGGITMNWIDSSGMMEPLSFEAIVTPISLDDDSEHVDDPWARSTVLEFVTPSEPTFTPEDAAISSEAAFAGDITAEALDTPQPPLDMSIALDEGDYGWERSQQGAATPEHGESALAYEALPLAGQASEASFVTPFDERDFTGGPHLFDLTTRPSPPVTQTLEDLWDETPDIFGR